MRVLLPFSSRRKKSDSESTSSTSVSGETVTSTNSSSNASNSEGTSSGSENSFGGHSPEEELAATVVSPFKKSLQSNDANQPSTEVIFERAKAHQGFLFELEEAEGEDNKVSPSQEPLKTALEGGFDVPEELQQTAPSFSVASVAKTHPYQPGFLLRDQTKKADSSSSQLLHSKRLAPSSLSAAVSDWATFGSTCFAHPPSSTPFDDIAADQTQRRSKKRLASSPVRDTPHCFDVVEPSITADIKVASILSAKRPRPDSKPAAKVLTPVPHTITNMAVGGRHKSDSDDESVIHQAPPRFWIQPAENEPPILQNHPVGVPPVAASCPANPHDPALDHGLDPALEGVGEEQSATDIVTVTETDKDDASLALFCDSLKKQGLEMVEQEGDGNCLFRAVSLQVYGSPDNHGEVRERCLDFMARNEEHYSSFVVAVASDDEDSIPVERAKSAFQAYILRKRINGVHGNHAEIQAISELFNRPIEVYTPGVTASHGQPQKPMNIFHAEYKTSDPPIRLSYHDGNHYNAIIDPLVPTAGLGLGLPGLKPGLADQMQVTKAKAESDQLADEMEFERVLKESQEELNGQQDDDLQRVLKESSRDFMYKQKAMALSDLDATNFELEQKVLASSMESYFRQEHGRKQKASAPAPAASGRRRRGSPPPPRPVDEPAYSSFAAIPPAAAAAAAAALPAVAAASLSSAAARMVPTASLSADEEYPQTVQELVMNGFELSKVVRAYELIGDNFDDLLSFLLSSSGTL